ncbi:hypothetical protein BC832DRAFT_588343 [Gaertneriomyces semiglobifer]|nr:hypothetical protein BC832DRAFT_588343 [Gaertneriomyces semiglobifer]
MIFSTLLNIKQLLEIKQKGRPASQCGHCRSKRRQGVGHSHHRCLCGDSANFVKKKVEATFEPSTVRLVFTPDKNNVAGIQKLLEEQPQSSLVISKKAKIARDALSESGNDSPLTPNLDPSATLLTITYTGLKVIEESYGLDYEKMISNPCKCQFGGSCVCSEIAAQSASKRSRQNSSATPPVVPPPAVHAATGAHLQGRFEKPAYEQLEFPADMVPGIANGSVPMSIAPARQSNMQPMSSPSALHSVVSSPAAPYHAMSPSQFGHLSTTSTNIFPMDMPQSMDGMFSPAAMAGSLQHAVYASENLNSLGGFGAAPSAVQQLNRTPSTADSHQDMLL